MLRPQFSMKSLIEYEDVMKSPSTVALSSSKQNDVNADSFYQMSQSLDFQEHLVRFRDRSPPTGSFIVKPLIFQKWAQYIIDGSLSGVELEQDL